MLYIFEYFAFAALVVFVVTQLILPAIAGRALMPLFHTRRRVKELQAVRRMKEDQELDLMIEDLLKSFGGVEKIHNEETRKFVEDYLKKRGSASAETIAAASAEEKQ
jgi:hypothetical protein